MKVSLPTIILIVLAVLVAFAAISTALAHLFAALSMPRAQHAAERIGIILIAVEHVAEDVSKAAPAGPVAMGVAALRDLDELAALDASGRATLAIARVKTMAKAFGVAGLVFLLGCSGASSLPVCASWGSARVGDKGAIPVCERWESPPTASASAEPSASAK